MATFVTAAPCRREKHAVLRRIRSGLVAAIAIAAVLGTATVAQAAAPAPVDPDTSLPPVAMPSRAESVPEDSRDDVLGAGWARSGDVATTFTGDAGGFSVLRGAAADGYAWKTLARLSVPGIETDQWIGNGCTTGDGAHVVVVYGPRGLTNDERLFSEGAWAAVVDTADGAVRSLGRGYSLSYANPGCGAGDTATLVRYDGGTTSIGAFTPSTGDVDWTARLKGELTSVVPLASGVVAAAAPGELVSVAADGERSRIAATTGTPYDLTVTAGRISWAEHRDTRAAIHSASLQGRKVVGSARTVATGRVDDLGIATDTAGRTWVTGSASTLAKGAPTNIRRARVASDAAISSQGRLATSGVRAVGGVDGATGVDTPVTVQSVSIPTSKKVELGTVVDAEAPGLPLGEAAPAPQVQRRTLSTTASSPSLPAEEERTCAVPRNDPSKQVLQPKPRQVEWAVNRIVAGQLTIKRPANWNSSGMAAYAPGTMFPKKSLNGGGSIPSQVLLGVLAQESNLWQASRYTSPGETGNPLIGNYYGNDLSASVSSSEFWKVSFANADCGYGVGQITDGMRLAGRERPGETALPVAQQQAIALDYTANIARAAQMLTDKWNETRAAGSTINNGDPSKIENWFAATWAYNTGYHQPDGSGPYGLGWFNNPANPIYPPGRGSFLDGRPADASKPQNWPYPEKVLGFAANALTLVENQTVDAGPTYVAAFRTAWWNGDSSTGPKNRTAVKPPSTAFCSMSNNECDPKTTAVCTRSDSECWWHGNVTWKKDCDTTCGNEFTRFSPAADYMTEQANGTSFPPNCSTSGLPSGSLVIDDLPMTTSSGTITSVPARSGCSPVTSNGTFAFDFGRRSASGSYPSKIDLHQLGSGFNGRFSFSHTWQNGEGPASQITGTWTLNKSLKQWGRVFVHTPDHAAWAQDARYKVNDGLKTHDRVLPQRNFGNSWKSIGVFNFNGVPKVSLSNVTGDGDDVDAAEDIAWDAVAIQPLSAKPKDFIVSIGDSYSSGEGSPGASTQEVSGYYPVTDNNGTVPRFKNACHRSPNAWVRKAAVRQLASIGSRADSLDPTLDFHQISCSGATTENLLQTKQSEPPQLQQGFLDENTTLVTLNIGGNDIGFAPVIQNCVLMGLAQQSCFLTARPGAYDKLSKLGGNIGSVISKIRADAPKATILFLGYPPIFSDGVGCVSIRQDDQGWLDQLAVDLNKTIADAVAAKDQPGARVLFADPKKAFEGRNICASNPAVNGLMPYTPLDYGSRTNGDTPIKSFAVPGPDFELGVAQSSFHPNNAGTSLYAGVMQGTLDGVY